MNGHKLFESRPMESHVAKANGVTINIGDIVQRNSSTKAPEPASLTLYDTNLATTQTTFAALFYGIALSAGRSADTNKIRIATTGVFEFDCATNSAFAPGDLVGPDTSGTSQGVSPLYATRVIASSTVARSIGRVWKYDTGASKVWVDIQSKIMLGGPNNA